MELFDTNGHLTDAALAALNTDTLDELTRLEVSEHLSFCDRCLDRYLAGLADSALEAPVNSCREGLLQRIRRQALRLLENRVATAAAAVAIVVSLWTGGAFEALGSLPGRLTALPNTVTQSIQAQQREDKPSIFEDIENWIDSFGNPQINFGGK